MPGLIAKVFRTYNASITLDEMLNKATKGGDVGEKIVVYNKENKELAGVQCAGKPHFWLDSTDPTGKRDRRMRKENYGTILERNYFVLFCRCQLLTEYQTLLQKK